MKKSPIRVLPRLPVFPEGANQKWQGVRVEGLVRRPKVLSLPDLEQLPQWTLTQDFWCEEGWTVPSQRWEGPRVANLLELAEVLPEARYVALSAGEYLVSLSLDEVTKGEAILAQLLNSAALPEEHGGPCRLIIAGKTCFYTVKWVDRILVLAQQPEETGREIALGRTRQAREI